MKPILVPVEEFKLDGFLEKIGIFLTEHHLPLDVLNQVDIFGFAHELEGLQSMEDWKQLLMKAEDLVFFPFSLAAAPDGITCVNGENYSSDVGIAMGEMDFLGYLLKVKQERVEVYSCLFHGGCYMPPMPATVEVIEYAGRLEEPMAHWIKQFTS